MSVMSDARRAIIETWLKEQGTTLFGRAYDIVDPDGRHECAIALADLWACWDKIYDDLVDMRDSSPSRRLSDE